MEYKKSSEINQGLTYLKDKVTQSYDEKDALSIINGMMEKRVVSLRVNSLKSTVLEIKQALEQEKIAYEAVPWFDHAFVVFEKENVIENLSIYQEGKIYLQSLSSMIPPLILDPKPHTDILDMAAAPGGKTTEIAALTNNKAFITACEASPIRAEKLKFNVMRQGAKNVTILIKDATKLDDFFRFDQIMLDAPCSGSGTIDLNDERSYRYFSQKLVEKSVEVQLNLLRKAVFLLKPGQEMVYSTCSVLPEENEVMIQKLLKTNQMELVPINLEPFKDIPKLKSKIDGTLLIPPSMYYEGFFIAKLKKKSK